MLVGGGRGREMKFTKGRLVRKLLPNPKRDDKILEPNGDVLQNHCSAVMKSALEPFSI